MPKTIEYTFSDKYLRFAEKKERMVCMFVIFDARSDRYDCIDVMAAPADATRLMEMFREKPAELFETVQ